MSSSLFGSKSKDAKKNEASKHETPKSPSLMRTLSNHPSKHDDGEKFLKWKTKEQANAAKMAHKAFQEEAGSSNLPLGVRQLEFCPAPTRRHTQFLLSGYLAVKTSGGWTRKWQCRYCVLTPSFLYLFKRPPSPTDHEGPQITQAQSSSVTVTQSLEKNSTLANTDDVITDEKLQKLISVADTAEDGSHELFGLIRESMPINNNTMVLQVDELPHTIALCYPDCPRFLLRAQNFEQFQLWLSILQTTMVLHNTPAEKLAATIANKAGSSVYNTGPITPLLEDTLPVCVERSGIISQISLHDINQGLYQDTKIVDDKNKATLGDDAILVQAVSSPTGGAVSAAAAAATTTTTAAKTSSYNAPPTSASINNQLITQSQVNLSAVPNQGAIITNITPWGQKINIVLNQLASSTNTTTTPYKTSDSPSTVLENNVKSNAVTITLADGGYITLPLQNLYDLYQLHNAQLSAKGGGNNNGGDVSITTPPVIASPASTTTTIDATSTDPSNVNRILDQYANGLFVVTNSFYNADVQFAWRFVTLPGVIGGVNKDGKKENKKAAKAAAKAAEKKKQQLAQQEQRGSKLESSVSSLYALASLGLVSWLAYGLHQITNQDNLRSLITLWLTYLLLVYFVLQTAGIQLRSSLSRQSLANDSNAIVNAVKQAGLPDPDNDDAAAAAAAAASAAAAAAASSSAPTVAVNTTTIPVLELIPVRIVDRHTITGAVLLGGCAFDNDRLPPLPARTSYVPQISLIKAMHSTNRLNSVKAVSPLGDYSLSDDEDELSTHNASENESDAEDSDDDDVEMDPVLGRIYTSQFGKWCQSDYRGIVLRGPDYLTNKKKPKIPALPHRFSSCFCGIFAIKEAQPHCARWVDSYFRQQRQKARDLGKGALWEKGTPLKYLVVNMLVPGDPNYNFCMYFRNEYIYPSPFPDHIQKNHQQEYHPLHPTTCSVVYPSEVNGKPDPLARLINDFVTKDDEYRKSRFKYIPNVAEGAWFVRRTVGQTPVILGNKLNQKYYLDPQGQYVEVDVDVASSSMAGSILNIVKGYAQTLAIDLNFLLEPHHDEELPEALWGGVRIIHVNLNAITPIEVEHGPEDD